MVLQTEIEMSWHRVSYFFWVGVGAGSVQLHADGWVMKTGVKRTINGKLYREGRFVGSLCLGWIFAFWGEGEARGGGWGRWGMGGGG